MDAAVVTLPLFPLPEPPIELDPDALAMFGDGTAHCGAVCHASEVTTGLPATEAEVTVPALRCVGPCGTLEFAPVAALAVVFPTCPFADSGGTPDSAGAGPKRPCTAAANCAANPPAPAASPGDALPFCTDRRLLEPISAIAFTLIEAPVFERREGFIASGWPSVNSCNCTRNQGIWSFADKIRRRFANPPGQPLTIDGQDLDRQSLQPSRFEIFFRIRKRSSCSLWSRRAACCR